MTALTHLGRMLKLYSAVDGVSMAELAKEIGISKPTLYRLVAGEELNQRNFLKVVNWMVRDV